MILLKAKIREKFGRKTHYSHQELIPAILYGSEIKNFPLEIDRKQFEKVYKETGESSLISLQIEGENSKKFDVLIHDVEKDPLTKKILHVDFYCPSTKKEVKAEIPLVFERETPVVKELGGILIREIQTVIVKGLAQKLPREIKVNISKLKNFQDRILIKDLEIPEGITILKSPEEIVALIGLPEKEEEIKPVEEKPVEEKPIEEKVTETETTEKTKS